MSSITDLQELARANVPESLKNVPGYRVAIFRHLSSRETARGADFEWIGSKGDAKFHSIRKSYLCQQPSTGEICFLHEGRLIEDRDDTVESLDLLGEKIVVVEAVLFQDILKRTDLKNSATRTLGSSKIKIEPEGLEETENASSASSSKDDSSADSLERETEKSEDRPEERIKRLQAAIDTSSVESLEAESLTGHSILPKLSASLRSFNHPRVDTSRWLTDIARLEEFYKRPRTLIGMLGPTGAGKSSLVNALLNEEGVLPTSSIRACTAVPSEIAYQHGESQYRAEVVYITEEEWRTELQVLLKDIENESEDGTSKDSDEDSEGEAAYSKVKALYPDFKINEAARSDVASLVARVQHVLGTTKELEAEDFKTMCESLEGFISMPEQNMKREHNSSRPKDMEIWPLVKVVRLYLKSQILKNGAVLVDLPGVGDSNAARSAITHKYLKECDAFWIVAPIHRAADNKLAKSLLSDSFRLQLKMDCMFDATTFICTKADDFRTEEITKSLGLASTLEPLWHKIENGKTRRKTLEAHLKTLRRDREKTIEKLEKCLDDLDRFQERNSEEKIKVEPISSNVASFKRRASSNAGPAPKRAKGEEVKSAALQDQKRELRGKKDSISDLISEENDQLEKSHEDEKDLRSQIACYVVQARNEYCRRVIKDEFEAEQTHSNDSDPEIAGDKNVSHHLPVFCISSLASQKLQGRFPRDEEVSGFKDIEDTDIPALRRHCLNLTMAARKASCRLFLTKLYGFLTSASIWANSLEELPRDSAACLSRGMCGLEPCSEKLSERLQELIRRAAEDLRGEIEEEISSQFPEAIESVVKKAKATSSRWASKYLFQTYRAVCRRRGVFKEHDWNRDLVRPLLNRISPGWQKIFGIVIPRHLDQLAKEIGDALAGFHAEIRAAMEPTPALLKTDVLDSQIENYARISRDMCESKTIAIGRAHKEINRGLEIKGVMEDTYDLCADQTGPGAFIRMKAQMSRKVADLKDEVFGASCVTVRKQLEHLVDTTEDEMKAEIKEQLAVLRRDYLTALGGLNAELDEATLEAHRELAAKIMEVLATIGNREER